MPDTLKPTYRIEEARRHRSRRINPVIIRDGGPTRHLIYSVRVTDCDIYELFTL